MGRAGPGRRGRPPAARSCPRTGSGRAGRSPGLVCPSQWDRARSTLMPTASVTSRALTATGAPGYVGREMVAHGGGLGQARTGRAGRGGAFGGRVEDAAGAAVGRQRDEGRATESGAGHAHQQVAGGSGVHDLALLGIVLVTGRGGCMARQSSTRGRMRSPDGSGRRAAPVGAYLCPPTSPELEHVTDLNGLLLVAGAPHATPSNPHHKTAIRDFICGGTGSDDRSSDQCVRVFW